MHDQFPRRGRPSTGAALTPAERKAIQRERDRTIRPIEGMTLEAVLSGAGGAVKAGDPAKLSAFVAELQRRARMFATGQAL